MNIIEKIERAQIDKIQSEKNIPDFGPGDTIKVDGKEGEVVDINLRYITLNGEDSKMLVPNSLLVSKSLEVKAKKEQ